MGQALAQDEIRRTFTVPMPREEAFTLFTEGFGAWWPAEYTWAGNVLEWIGIEPREGGRCSELGPHGFSCDWGRVLAWDPPHRLVLTWQISPARVPEPDPARASEIEVRFAADGSSATGVEFEHRYLARHGEGGGGYHAAMDSAQGWTLILDRYARKCSTIRSA